MHSYRFFTKSDADILRGDIIREGANAFRVVDTELVYDGDNPAYRISYLERHEK